MPAKVIDASVLAAFAFGEPRAAEAASLMEDSEHYAPSILPYELCSVAVKKIRSEPSAQVAIQTALAETLRIPLVLVDVPGGQVLSLALLTGLSVYDAAHLYLAREKEAIRWLPLIEASRRLSRVS